MPYEAHTWMNNELITAEKLNRLEQGVENEQIGPAGPKGEKGDTGPAGEGLTGEAPVLTALTGSEELGAVRTKINEIISALNTRGISREE
ncbi:hypothetical protein QUW58_23010 [Enterocloster aldenensis]|uniref:hypothetical protein n=1 Tax=Enterocloster aldenensis TaxID=358742 RepID=UPI0025A3B754|nr:hypothetical protein [Enterocloster aldenensis]